MFTVIFVWMNEVGGVNVGQKSSVNHKMVAWEVRGFRDSSILCTIDDILVLYSNFSVHSVSSVDTQAVFSKPVSGSRMSSWLCSRWSIFHSCQTPCDWHHLSLSLVDTQKCPHYISSSILLYRAFWFRVSILEFYFSCGILQGPNHLNNNNCPFQS